MFLLWTIYSVLRLLDLSFSQLDMLTGLGARLCNTHVSGTACSYNTNSVLTALNISVLNILTGLHLLDVWQPIQKAAIQLPQPSHLSDNRRNLEVDSCGQAMNVRSSLPSNEECRSWYYEGQTLWLLQYNYRANYERFQNNYFQQGLWKYNQ